MPKFDFEIPVPTDSQKAFDKIKIFLNSENNFKKFDPKMTCTFDEATKTCQLNGSQFKAALKVHNDATQNETPKSKVHIEVDLPFALSLFKGKIKEEIEKNFKRVLG